VTRYRRKPLLAQAEQYDPAAGKWPDCLVRESFADGSVRAYLFTPPARHEVFPGDWIVREPSGDLAVLSNIRFQECYEPVEDESPPSGWTAVSSSNIALLRYREPNLDVQFRSGVAYRYADVPPAVFDALLSGVSPAGYLNTCIKPYYTWRKLSDEEIVESGGEG
jgi:hypothetical protein